ncbi:MAG: glycosyltransferase family 2 protein [Deltaproteobacteria bacterium]
MNFEKSILFSIIIPTFNRANMISRAIESVIAQTYTNWELIIVNDGSIDNSEEVVKKYQLKDNRIKYYFQENKGRSAARNLGIDNSSGEYICFLDDDDYYFEDFLYKFYFLIISTSSFGKILMCRQYELINDQMIEVKLNEKKLLQNPLKYLILLSNNLQPFAIPTLLLKHEKFDERFGLGEDFHLLIRLLISEETVLTNYFGCVYNNHDSMTMKLELEELLFLKYKYNRLDMLEDLFNNYNNLLKSNLILKDLKKKYNQIAYFYGSICLKKFYLTESLIFRNKIILGDILSYYFNISLFLRSLSKQIKCLKIIRN